MNPFPEEHDLIWLFEAEPTTTDAGIGWYYNHVSFVTERGSDKVAVDIWPSYGEVAIKWERDGDVLTSAEVHGVEGMSVLRETTGEGLRLDLEESDTVTLWLKPTVHLRWSIQPKHFAKDS